MWSWLRQARECQITVELEVRGKRDQALARCVTGHHGWPHTSRTTRYRGSGRARKVLRGVQRHHRVAAPIERFSVQRSAGLQACTHTADLKVRTTSN
jgi:hypothetical protein